MTLPHAVEDPPPRPGVIANLPKREPHAHELRARADNVGAIQAVARHRVEVGEPEAMGNGVWRHARLNVADHDARGVIAHVHPRVLVALVEAAQPVQAPELAEMSKTYTGETFSYEVAQSEYYIVRGTTSASAAGDYTVTVTLRSTTNFVWSTGGTANLSVTWHITKAENGWTEHYEHTGWAYKGTESGGNINLAFDGLEKIVDQRVSNGSMGFGAKLVEKNDRDIDELLSLVEPQDLIKYGLITIFKK